MRSAFVRSLTEIAREDPRVFLLIGDVGFNVVEKFGAEFPGRLINVGVAEANLTGISAGLALSGKIPFTYSIANFPTLRCLEQIRNDVCYQNANVKIVSVGGGFAYGSLGASHHATEDLAILRSLPNMVVLAPGDPCETELCVRAAHAWPGPVYIRLGREGDPVVHSSPPKFAIGRAIRIRDGTDLTFIGCGGILPNVVAASDSLSLQGLSAGVLSMPTIKPLDAAAVLSAAEETGAIFTVEEHSIIGGLGGAVAEVLAESSPARRIRFKRIGSPDRFSPVVGSQEYLRNELGLSADGIAHTAAQVMGFDSRSRHAVTGHTQ